LAAAPERRRFSVIGAPVATARAPPPPLLLPRTGAGVLAIDLAAMEPVRGATVLRGDFTRPDVVRRVRAELTSAAGVPSADAVLSDMAPSFSGDGDLDTLRQMALAWRALVFSLGVLRPGRGSLVLKVRPGREYDAMRGALQRLFADVAEAKPHASRASSAETYLVARQFAGGPGARLPPDVVEIVRTHGVEPE
jgi:23S rRNA U2552 (ribose-2'-O)-methylase RlmE/FtsJ